MFSLNSTNSVTEIFVITAKRLEPATSCARDQDATTAPARHVRDRIFKLSPIFSDLSDPLKSLTSLNLMKVLPHLEKTPMFLSEWPSYTTRREKFLSPHLLLAYYETWQQKCHSENYRFLIPYLDMIHKDHGEVKKKEKNSLELTPRLVQVRWMLLTVVYVAYWLHCCLFKR